jgi:glycosyltransferase involved in cell wall biosynthesis
MLHVHYWGECDDPWYAEVFEAARKHRCMVVENVNTPVETYVDETIDHYVYVSNYAMNFSPVIPDPATVIYPGSNLDMFNRGGVPIPDDVIGMVYRLEKDKLREDSIQVLIDVIRNRPGTKAIIVSGGSLMAPYKEQVAAQGIAENFEFTGYVPYEKLPEYYRRLSIFVAPVWKESFGQVSPFAMGMEIPVTGYRVGALSEILGSDECLGASREELVDIIISLLDNRDERLRIGTRNRERVISLFSMEAMITRYERLYESLMRQEGIGSSY